MFSNEGLRVQGREDGQQRGQARAGGHDYITTGRRQTKGSQQIAAGGGGHTLISRCASNSNDASNNSDAKSSRDARNGTDANNA